MRKFLTLVAVLVALAGCTALKVATTPIGAPTLTQLRNDVLAAKTGYEAVLVIAVDYNNIPRCGLPKSPPICSDPGIIAQLRSRDVQAANALDAAEAIVRQATPDITAAQALVLTATNAVAAYKAIVTTNHIGGQ